MELVSTGTVGAGCSVLEDESFASVEQPVSVVAPARASQLGELVVVPSFAAVVGLVACYVAAAAAAVVAAAVAELVVVAAAAAVGAPVLASSESAAALEGSSLRLEHSLSSAPIELD